MPDDKGKIPEVNLLPSEELEGRPGGIFLKWALTWGKRIVVTTELIVILAFLSRFWLDTEVANLSENIDQKKAIVLAQSQFEDQFRSLSKRVDKAKSLEALSSPLDIYDKVKPMIPLTVYVSQLSVDKHGVSLSASTDEISLGKIVDVFKAASDFTNVSVEQVSQKGGTGTIEFSLRAELVSTISANGNH